MQIANPIYDAVFKYLMENERIAKFFISTILDTTILNLELKTREFTYEDKGQMIRIFRLNFIAIIETPTGSKKVLIEVQKAPACLQAHLVRFRKYLGDQYSRLDSVADSEEALSIVTIYILGFTLKGINSACFHVRRSYQDMLNGCLIEERTSFVELLTHDSYIIQVPLIAGRYQTRLERLLSIFEQRYFMGNTTLKDYPHDVGSDVDLQTILDTLYRAGSDTETREALDLEVDAWRVLEELMGKTSEKEQLLEEKTKALEEKNEELRTKEKALEDKDAKLKTKDKALEDKDAELKTKDKALEDKDAELKTKDKALEDKEKLIAELRKQLDSEQN